MDNNYYLNICDIFLTNLFEILLLKNLTEFNLNLLKEGKIIKASDYIMFNMILMIIKCVT